MEVVERERVTGEESTETALRNALAALEQSKRDAVCVAQEQAATLRQYWQGEVESYKVCVAFLSRRVRRFLCSRRSSHSSMPSP